MKKKVPSKDQIRKYTREFTQEAIEYINKNFDLDLEKHGKFKITISFDHRRVSSLAAFYKRNKRRVPGMNLSVVGLITDERNTFSEYEHLNIVNKKAMGTLHNLSWKKFIRVLVSHEISHIVEQIILGKGYNVYNPYRPYYTKKYDSKTTKRLRKKMEKAAIKYNLDSETIYNHGVVFCAVYTIIRNKFVNGKKK